MMKTTLSLALYASSFAFASDLEDDARRYRNPDRKKDPNGGYCTWDEDSSDGTNARAWMRRCGRIDDEADCGTWAAQYGYDDGACVWVPKVEWMVYDETGFPLYDDNGYAVLQEYEEMCGGRNADQACYECFECHSDGDRCVPINNRCTPHCEVDDDCTREQVCMEVDDEMICQLPNGPPNYNNEDRGNDRKNRRKGGKGNRGSGAGPMDSDELAMETQLAAQRWKLSAFEPRDTTAAWYTVALLALFICALMVIATRKLKSSEPKQLVDTRPMHCVVDGQAVF